jgi:hypothetical protein
VTNLPSRPGTKPAALPADVPGLLRELLAEPGRPRVTWYGPDGERVELSAKVLDNWVAKSANLLVDELDVGPGSAVLVDLSIHWRTVVWLLAIWATGAAAVLPSTVLPSAVLPSAVLPSTVLPSAVLPSAADQPPSPDQQPSPDQPPGTPPLPAGLHPDAILTARPQVWAGAATFSGATVLAVALPALASRFTGVLPPTALDAATEVRVQGDVFVPVVRPVPADAALITPDGVVTTHGELLAAAAAKLAQDPAWPTGARLLTGSGPDQVLTGWLPALLAGGSLVLHHDLAGLDAAARDRLVGQESVQIIA